MSGGEPITCRCNQCGGAEAIVTARKAHWLSRQDNSPGLVHLLVTSEVRRMTRATPRPPHQGA